MEVVKPGLLATYSCEFCSQTFETIAQKTVHIFKHFEQEICGTCDQILIHIGENVYVLHSKTTCMVGNIKSETPSNALIDEYEPSETSDHLDFSFDQNSIEKAEAIDDALDQENNLDLADIELGENKVPEIRNESMECYGEGRLSKSPTKVNREKDKLQTCQANKKILQTEANKNIRFECDICKKSFNRKQTIKLHMVDFHNAVKFRCNVCDATFEKMFQMTKHKKSIRKCQICKEIFCGEALLLSHQAKQHNGQSEKQPARKSRKKTCSTNKHPTRRHNLKIQCQLKPIHRSVQRKCQMKNDNTKFWQTETNKKTRFDCDMCKKSFFRKDGIKLHMVAFHNAVKFRCNVCDATFEKMFQMINHKNSIEKCQICKEIFCGEALLLSHQAKQHNGQSEKQPARKSRKKIERPHVCNICGKAYTTWQPLQKHISKIHDQTKSNDQNIQRKFQMKNRRFDCDLCKRTFKKKAELKIHMINIHMPSEKRFKCNECGNSYAQNFELINHKKLNVICNICGKIFCHQKLLWSHQEEVHEFADNKNIAKPSKCTLDGCDEIVAPYKWVEHMASKHGSQDGWSRCDICDKTFKRKHQIREHMKNTHYPPSKKFKCDVDDCTFSATLKCYLKQHQMKKHSETNKTNERNFMCSECGARFAKKIQFKNHMYRHLDIKPLVCPFESEGCTKRFRCSSQRIEHVRMHTGERPFCCSVEGCDRRFAYRIDLKRHQFSSHGIYTKKYPCEICSEIFPENMLLKKHMEKHANNF